MPGLTLTDLRETATAPASNAGNADAAAHPVRLEPPQNRTILRTSTSRRGRSVPGKRVCAASRRQNRDGASSRPRRDAPLRGSRRFRSRRPATSPGFAVFPSASSHNLALGAMAFADQTSVASLLHLRRVNENGAANSIHRYRQGECRDR